MLALAAIIALLARSRPDPRRLAVAAAVATAGLGLWALTRSGAAWCDVLGPWGHAAWHVLIATAAVLAMSAVRE